LAALVFFPFPVDGLAIPTNIRGCFAPDHPFLLFCLRSLFPSLLLRRDQVGLFPLMQISFLPSFGLPPPESSLTFSHSNSSVVWGTIFHPPAFCVFSLPSPITRKALELLRGRYILTPPPRGAPPAFFVPPPPVPPPPKLKGPGILGFAFLPPSPLNGSFCWLRFFS